jgi:hypothetical protein
MMEASTHDCKYITWTWLNQTTGEIKPFNCGSWNCRQHQGAVAYHWACRVSEAHPERMITLTNIPHDKTDAYLGFQQLVRDIRAEGMRFDYARFLEVGHETGMRHFHIAERGDFIPVRWLSKHAAANGLGKIVHAEHCHGAGPQFYLAKYITKDDASLPGWRKVASSRGFFRAKELPADIRDSDWILRKA